jgi:hypothetical protein
MKGTTLLLTLLATFALNTSGVLAQPNVPPSNFSCRLKIVHSASAATSDETVVYFNPSSSDSYINSEDAPKFPQLNALLIYSIVSGQYLAINAMGALTQEKIIDIGYQVPAASTVTISYTPFDLEVGNYYANGILELQDLVAGVSVNLMDTNSYSFTSSAGTFNNRIRLRMSAPSYVFTTPGSCTDIGSAYVTNYNNTPVGYQVLDSAGNVVQAATNFTGIAPLNINQAGSYSYNFYYGTDSSTFSTSLNMFPSIDVPNMSLVFYPDSVVNMDDNFFMAEVSWPGFDSFQDSAFWEFGDGNSYWGFLVDRTFSAPGIYPVTLTGYGDSCSATISFNIHVYTITGNATLKGQFSGYVNNNTLTLQNKEASLQDLYLTVSSISGQELLSRRVIMPSGSSTQLPLEMLPKGIYFARMQGAGVAKTIRFVIH